MQASPGEQHWNLWYISLYAKRAPGQGPHLAQLQLGLPRRLRRLLHLRWHQLRSQCSLIRPRTAPTLVGRHPRAAARSRPPRQLLAGCHMQASRMTQVCSRSRQHVQRRTLTERVDTGQACMQSPSESRPGACICRHARWYWNPHTGRETPHLVHDERRDQQAQQGGHERAPEPGHPGARDGHAQLGRQLHAQQVLRSCREEQRAAVHAALELRLHQELAQPPRTRLACAYTEGACLHSGFRVQGLGTSPRCLCVSCACSSPTAFQPCTAVTVACAGASVSERQQRPHAQCSTCRIALRVGFGHARPLLPCWPTCP